MAQPDFQAAPRVILVDPFGTVADRHTGSEQIGSPSKQPMRRGDEISDPIIVGVPETLSGYLHPVLTILAAPQISPTIIGDNELWINMVEKPDDLRGGLTQAAPKQHYAHIAGTGIEPPVVNAKRPHISIEEILEARPQSAERPPILLPCTVIADDQIPGVVWIDANQFGRGRPDLVDPVVAAALDARSDIHCTLEGDHRYDRLV